MIKNEKSEQQLKTLLQNINQNYKIEYFSTIDSTNTYAKNLLEKQNQQEVEDPQQHFDFLLESSKRCCFVFFLLSKCSRIPLVIQQCVVKETFLLKS